MTTENTKVIKSRIEDTSTADLWNFACLVVSLFCCFLILIGRSQKMDSLVSVGSRIMIVFQFFCVFLVELFVRGIKDLKKDYALFLLLFMIFALCGVIYLSELMRDYVMFFCTLMFPAYLLSFYRLRHVRKAKIAIYIFGFIVSIYFTYLFFSPLSHIYYGEYGEVIVDSLTLGFPNPNEAGIYLMVTVFILFSCAFEGKGVVIKAVSILDAVFLIYMTYLTQSRTCFFLIAITVVATAFRLIKYINKRVILVAFVLPVIFFVVFLLFPETMKSWIVMGEAVDSGRSFYYSEVLEWVDLGSFFFGNFGEYLNMNMHNSYASLFVSFGAFGTIAYLVYLWHMYSIYFAKMKTAKKPNYIAFAGALCILVHGVSESAFLLSGVSFAMFGCLLFVLSLPTETKQ